jgi:hypothetical protein
MSTRQDITTSLSRDQSRDASDRYEARARIIADLNVFLNEVGMAALGDAADYNELGYASVDGETMHTYGPNGIPDWAEFAVIDALVQDPSVDFTAYSGVGGETVKTAYEDWSYPGHQSQY